MRLLALWVNFIFIFSANATEPEQKIAVISDLNGSYGSTTYGLDTHEAVQRLVELKPNLILATGDLVAGQKAGLDYRSMWKAFHSIVTTPLEQAGIPLAVTVGNHDGSAYPNYVEERAIFEEEWKNHLPRLQFSDTEHYPFFYSFELGDHFFISIDSTKVGPLSFIQLAWIEKELKNHQNKKYISLFTHVPLFHFADIKLNESYFDEELMKLIDQYRVTFYLTGHHHSYYPGFFHQTHFISQSCLGSGPTTLNGRNQVSEKSFTMIDFYPDHFEIYALKAPLYLEKIDHNTLPLEINSKGKTLSRKDRSDLK